MSDIESSQVYSPDSQQQSQNGAKEVPYRRRLEKTTQNTVEGKWTDQEHLKYILYMVYHTKTFVSKQKRKSTKIFKSLSELLRTRTPRQCRSHFQKIMNKFKKVNNIKAHIIAQLGNDQFQRQYALLVSQLEPHGGKSEDSSKCENLSKTSVSVQTEPFQIKINDLPNEQILKLMNIMEQYEKIRLPFFPPPTLNTLAPFLF